jgi:hypothetical protein
VSLLKARGPNFDGDGAPGVAAARGTTPFTDGATSRLLAVPVHGVATGRTESAFGDGGDFPLAANAAQADQLWQSHEAVALLPADFVLVEWTGL